MKCLERGMQLTGRDTEDLINNDCPLTFGITPNHSCNEECGECWESELINDWMVQFTDSPIWNGNDYPTREIAIEEGKKQAIHEIGKDLKPITKFYVGKKRLISLPSIDVTRLLETLDEDYQDEINPELKHDSYLFENVSREQEEELETKLNEIFDEWCMRNKVHSYSYTIEDIEEIVL